MLIFDGAEIGNHYIIAVHSVALLFWLIGAAALGIYTEYIANKPQPTPDADAWRVAAS